MAGLGIDGLASSLETTSIITQLMQLEARPQTLLKTKLTATTSFLADLRSLNTAVAGIATSAKDVGSSASLALFSATASSDAATATARTGASAGSVTFRVQQTAQAQSIVTGAMTKWGSDPAVLTIKGADGTLTEITAASTSLEDVAAAINSAGAGVTATRVASGKAADGTAQYRLQLTAAQTGSAGAFTAYRGAKADVAAGTAPSLLAESGADQVAAARDASIVLWEGSSAEQTLTSSTNTFAEVLGGTDITVAKAATEPVTVTVAQDGNAASAVASGFVAKLSALFGTISVKSKVTPSTNAAGTPIVSAGSFTGDSTVRQLKDALLTAVIDPVEGKSLSTIGISVTRDGSVSFDAAKFGEALKSDPAGTQRMFSAAAARVQEVAEDASDSLDGFLTSKVTGQENAVKSLNENIAAWDLRLAKRKDMLQRQYTAMETAMSSIQSQSNWLASQLAALTPTSN
ncbi:flagellar filament capping protein FliD [Naasia sp. SYSU D00057]|uniref:flagellar filament capping protein FliD n=1 Tax=Naasia sp. SYSU D00057 TaxID=2817380 RepID=UPI001B3132F3|nr:flagellar filament capping protein FliD [Naasia sp. SYSU D00057]